MGKEVRQDHFPATFLDNPKDIPVQPRRDSIRRQNRETTALVRRLLLPSPIRQAFPMTRHPSPFADLFNLLHGDSSSTPSRSKVLQTSTRIDHLTRFLSPFAG